MRTMILCSLLGALAVTAACSREPDRAPIAPATVGYTSGGQAENSAQSVAPGGATSGYIPPSSVGGGPLDVDTLPSADPASTTPGTGYNLGTSPPGNTGQNPTAAPSPVSPAQPRHPRAGTTPSGETGAMP